MNHQERDEVAELVLRAVRLNFDAGVLHASRGVSLEALVLGDNEAHAAQRELWEALYRIRLDDSGQNDERARRANVHLIGERAT